MNNVADISVDELKQEKVNRVEKMLNSLKQAATVAELMRVVGAVVMVASLAVLILNDWSVGSDIQRYVKVLGMTGLLAAGGFGLSYILREQKGARLFFGLAQLSIPVNFGILGGLIYSVFPESGLVSSYPAFAKWVIADFSTVAMLMAGALLILVPISLLVFRISSRTSASTLTCLFLGLNALLLLPFRHATIVGFIVIVAVIVPILYVYRLMIKEHNSIAGSRKMVVSLLFLPALIMVGRNLYLYHLDVYLVGILFVSLYVLLRQCAVHQEDKIGYQPLLNIFLGPLAFGSAICAVDLLPGSSSIGSYALFSLILAAHMIDFHMRIREQSLVKSMNIGVSISLISSVIGLSILTEDSMIAVCLHLFSTVAIVLFGAWVRSRVIVCIGGLLVIFATWFGFNDMIALLFTGNWIAMAIVGVTIIVTASIVDRHGAAIKYQIRQRFSIEKS